MTFFPGLTSLFVSCIIASISMLTVGTCIVTVTPVDWVIVLFLVCVSSWMSTEYKITKCKWSEKEEKGIFAQHLERRKGTLRAGVGKTMLTKYFICSHTFPHPSLKLSFSHVTNLRNGLCLVMLSFWSWEIKNPVCLHRLSFLARQCL